MERIRICDPDCIRGNLKGCREIQTQIEIYYESWLISYLLTHELTLLVTLDLFNDIYTIDTWGYFFDMSSLLFKFLMYVTHFFSNIIQIETLSKIQLKPLIINWKETISLETRLGGDIKYQCLHHITWQKSIIILLDFAYEFGQVSSCHASLSIYSIRARVTCIGNIFGLNMLKAQ